MPNFSGSYSAKTKSQTTASAPGNHQIGVSVASGEQKIAGRQLERCDADHVGNRRYRGRQWNDARLLQKCACER